MSTVTCVTMTTQAFEQTYILWVCPVEKDDVYDAKANTPVTVRVFELTTFSVIMLVQLGKSILKFDNCTTQAVP